MGFIVDIHAHEFNVKLAKFSEHNVKSSHNLAFDGFSNLNLKYTTSFLLFVDLKKYS